MHDNQVLYAHKVLLHSCACDEFVQLVESKISSDLFTHIEEEGPILIVDVKQTIEIDAFRCILEFLYSGTVTFMNISKPAIDQLSVLAQELKLDDILRILHHPNGGASRGVAYLLGLVNPSYGMSSHLLSKLQLLFNQALFSDGKFSIPHL